MIHSGSSIRHPRQFVSVRLNDIEDEIHYVVFVLARNCQPRNITSMSIGLFDDINNEQLCEDYEAPERPDARRPSTIMCCAARTDEGWEIQTSGAVVYGNYRSLDTIADGVERYLRNVFGGQGDTDSVSSYGGKGKGYDHGKGRKSNWDPREWKGKGKGKGDRRRSISRERKGKGKDKGGRRRQLRSPEPATISRDWKGKGKGTKRGGGNLLRNTTGFGSSYRSPSRSSSESRSARGRRAARSLVYNEPAFSRYDDGPRINYSFLNY